MKVVRIANSVQATYRAYDYHVTSSGHKGRCRAYAQFVNFVVDAKVFFYVRVRDRNVSFRLVIVVIGDEIFYRIFREKGFEFAIQLGREGFVVAKYKRRSLKTLDDIRHGKSFAGTGYTK